jgi:hypothetical protein
MTIRPKVLTAQPDTELTWAASLPGIIGGEHTFTLSPTGDGTRLVQSETFRGLLVPFAGKTITNAETGFRALIEARREPLTRHRSCPHGQTPRPRGMAQYGYCASHSRYFWGLLTA